MKTKQQPQRPQPRGGLRGSPTARISGATALKEGEKDHEEKAPPIPKRKS